MLLTGVLRQREWDSAEGEKRYAFEVDVTEIGASLKWATATVTKPTRGIGHADTGGGADDPCGDDKPPF